jgi:hypothetical protein
MSLLSALKKTNNILVTGFLNYELTEGPLNISMIFWSLFCSMMSWMSVLGDIFDILVTVYLNYELVERPEENE